MFSHFSACSHNGRLAALGFVTEKRTTNLQTRSCDHVSTSDVILEGFILQVQYTLLVLMSNKLPEAAWIVLSIKPDMKQGKISTVW